MFSNGLCLYAGSHSGLKEIIRSTSNMEEGWIHTCEDVCFNIPLEHFFKSLNDNLFISLLRIGLV